MIGMPQKEKAKGFLGSVVKYSFFNVLAVAVQ